MVTSIVPESCQCHVVPGSGLHNPDPVHTVVDVVGGTVVVGGVGGAVVVGAAVVGVGTAVNVVVGAIDVDGVVAIGANVDTGTLEATTTDVDGAAIDAVDDGDVGTVVDTTAVDVGASTVADVVVTDGRVSDGDGFFVGLSLFPTSSTEMPSLRSRTLVSGSSETT